LNKKSSTVNKHAYYQQLWNNFLKGDMPAFREIYTDFYPFLFNFGLIYVEKPLVENSIQDLFLYILEHRGSLKKVKNVKAYFITAYKHRLFKIIKEQNKTVALHDNIFYDETKDEAWQGIFTKVLNKLTPREKEIVQLKYFQNYCNKEISNHLNIEYQTVRNILYRAIKKLRFILMDLDPALLG